MANVTVTGVRAPSVAATPPTSLLTDYFADLSGWSTITQSSGVGIAATNGELQISIPVFASGNRYGVVASTSTINLTGATVTTKVRVNNVEAGMDAGLTLRLDATNYLTIEATGASTTVGAYKYVAGVFTALGTGTAAASLTHFRIRELSGTVYLEYSTTGGMSWTTHSSVLVSALWAVTSLGIRLAGGDDGPTGSGTMVVAFDYLAVTKPVAAADGLLTAATGPVSLSGPTTVDGAGGGASGAGSVGLTGMFSGWTGPGVNAPFVIGVTAQATATAQPGSFPSTNITVTGVQATAAAAGQEGSFPLESPSASLVLEIDFVGNPAAPFYDQVSQSPGVVSYWRFDDAGQLTDTLGANTGAIIGTPTLVTGALAYDTDQALRFDGTTQYAQVPSTATLAQTGSYSLSGWLRFPTLPSAAKTIVSKGNYRLEINASNQLVWTVTNDQSGVLTNTSVTGHAAIEANTWYRVVGVHEFGVELRLYLNGVLDNSAAHTVGTELHTTPLTFSGLPFGTAPAFRAVSTAGNGAGFSNTSFVVPVPTVVVGDLMLAQVFDFNSVGFVLGRAPVVGPAGWNLLGSTGDYLGTVNGGYMLIYWRIATASEPASYTWTTANATNWGAAISTYSGVNTSDPFAKPFYGYIDSANVATHSTGPHLHTESNSLAVALIGGWNAVGTTVTSWSASATQRWQGGGASYPTGCVVGATLVPTAGVSTEIIATGINRPAQRALVTLRGTGIGSFTAADLDEWVFWNIALTDEQVANEYEARSSGVGTWTDVSLDAKGMALGYGRQYELNRMEGGSANVTLKNQLRKYDPANTSSVYAPNVKPNRRVRARAYYRGVYYPLWEGLIERWPSNWGISPNYDEVSLTSVDGYKALNRAGITPTQTAALSGSQIDLLLTRALWSIDARSIDAGAFIMAADTTTDNTTALSVIQDVTDSALGLFLIDHAADGSPATFHDRSHRWTTTRSTVSQATFTDQTSGGIRYQDLQPSDDDDNMVNEWIVTSANGTTATAVDSVSRQQNFPLTSERSTRLDNTLDADTQAKALIQQTARPGLRFDALTVRLMTQTTPIIWQTCLGLAISDRVTVIRNPVPGAGGSTISKDCFVEGISWEITPSYWDLSLRLSPVSTMGYYDVILLDDPVSYWRLDTTT